MAEILITVVQNYIGTAAERAAMTTTALPAGSKFFESDNHLWYIWTGSAWVAYELLPIA